MNAFLAVARAAAEAGAAQLAQRPETGTPLTVTDLGAETKSSGSDWVTDFDHRAEDAIRFVLQSYRPHDEIYGEEFGATTVENPSGYRWSIDPLDGTTNFIRGLPHYCSSVAVQYEGRWIAAAIVAPALGRSWWASLGGGAFTTRTGPLDVGLPSQPAEPVRLTGPVLGRSGRLLSSGFSYDPTRRGFQFEQLQRLLQTGEFSDLRRAGSAALDLCMVADGTLDAYAEYGLQEYDWAAGALIANEAGVPVRRPAWQVSDTTPDWIIAGDIGVEHHALEVDPNHPIGRTQLTGTVTTDHPQEWIDQLTDQHTVGGRLQVDNFHLHCTLGDGSVTVAATGPADQVASLKQRLGDVRW